MAYYTALQTKWVTLTGTVQSKIDQINALTVTGSIPTQFYTTGSDIANCINWPEFAALTATQQANVLALCQIPGELSGGSGNLSSLIDGMMIAYFPLAGPTIAALTALAKATVQPWVTTPVAQGGGGLSGPVSLTDINIAGLQ